MCIRDRINNLNILDKLALPRINESAVHSKTNDIYLTFSLNAISVKINAKLRNSTTIITNHIYHFLAFFLLGRADRIDTVQSSPYSSYVIQCLQMICISFFSYPPKTLLCSTSFNFSSFFHIIKPHPPFEIYMCIYLNNIKKP